MFRNSSHYFFESATLDDLHTFFFWLFISISQSAWADASGDQTDYGEYNLLGDRNFPLPSMYGIFTYIYHILPLETTIHVGKYTIFHGWYGFDGSFNGIGN